MRLRAADQAGIRETLEALPRGLDTPLAAGYRDGVDLSGGQWQRVALARAFYALRAGARILVLDEPTASLDVRSEAAFLDQFIDLTEGVADRIVVIDAGRVAELGTHDDLMERAGLYASLYRLQAAGYG